MGIDLASAARRTVSSAAKIVLRKSTRRIFKLSLPCKMRETSSKSSINCVCNLALRSMVSNAWVMVASLYLRVRSNFAHPKIGLRGF